ncbi:hypothetical protein [Fulvivirga ligni]|uniref:hypothetical protein n=1 Tax=Fulvivirga ligni TaxID=2904246 RepID=UPI001F246127|nr:hypothetical protein [Fulvivirga ligni]UII19147.1 hypothetical protein LVD16_14980 [Fulvivirga ligni]
MRSQTKRLFFKLSCIALLFSLTSCFDIIEEINVNNDGSGTMTLTVNLSKSKTKLASIMLLDSINGHKVPTEADVNHALSEAVSYLKESDGLSNIQKKVDFDNFIFSLSCDFKHVKNVNLVIQELTNKLKVKPFTTSFTYSNTSKTFNRANTFNTSAQEKYGKLERDDKEVFDNAFYTCIYRFGSEVKTFSNDKAKLSKSKKAIMLKCSAIDVINGNTSLSNKIELAE